MMWPTDRRKTHPNLASFEAQSPITRRALYHRPVLPVSANPVHFCAQLGPFWWVFGPFPVRPTRPSSDPRPSGQFPVKWGGTGFVSMRGVKTEKTHQIGTTSLHPRGGVSVSDETRFGRQKMCRIVAGGGILARSDSPDDSGSHVSRTQGEASGRRAEGVRTTTTAWAHAPSIWRKE